MASTSVREEIFNQQGTLLYEGVPVALLANIVNALIFTYMLRDVADAGHMTTWIAVFVLLVVLRFAVFLAFKKRKPGPDQIRTWITVMLAFATLFGVLWGTAAWLFVPHDPIQYHLLAAMVILALAAGGMNSLYPVLAAYVLFVVPVMALLAVRLVLIGTDLHNSVAVAVVVFMLFLIVFAKRHRDVLVKSLMLRIENRGLLAQLKTENLKVRNENEEMIRMELLLRKKSAVLDAVSQVQGLFIAKQHPRVIFDETLNTILQLTDSEYGFIGEVLMDEGGARYLKTFSVTNIAWNDETNKIYDENAPIGMEFRNQKSLFGEVLRTGEPVIANDPANDARAGGLPAGHPPLNAFLGIPVYMGERMVGMIGLANRPEGYSDELLIALEPVISAAGGMVEAVQSRRERDQAQRDAASAMESLTTAIEALSDGFAIYDSDDRLALCNSRYKEIYSNIGDILVPGTSFEETLRVGMERSQFKLSGEAEEEWIQKRLAMHRQKESHLEQKLANGRWLRIDERETPDGGRVGFRVDITELKVAQEELQLAIVEAEKSNNAKSEFLSSMSHELRTPLNAVLGFSQLMQLNPKVPLQPQHRDSVDQIMKAGNYLLELINEILELSRIEAGRVSLSVEEINPNDVIAECLAYIEPLAQKHGITVDTNVSMQGSYTLNTDRTRFKQVLLNLLSNAVKYNSEDGQVTFTVRSMGGGLVRFSVTDTGPGIAVEDQPKIFEPFTRLGVETGNIEGTGIGLTISRKLAELMGGELNFESAPGIGSTFWLELPGTEAGHGPSQSQTTSAEEIPEMPVGAHKVLYVEDNPDNLSLMEQVIEMVDGVELISAHTGELGIEMAEIHLPSAILMDINLPGINGDEAMKRLREMDETKDIPIIAVSANAIPREIKAALEAGFDAYITKPINLVDVIEHIKKAVKGELRTKAD